MSGISENDLPVSKKKKKGDKSKRMIKVKWQKRITPEQTRPIQEPDFQFPVNQVEESPSVQKKKVDFQVTDALRIANHGQGREG